MIIIELNITEEEQNRITKTLRQKYGETLSFEELIRLAWAEITDSLADKEQ